MHPLLTIDRTSRSARHGLAAAAVAVCAAALAALGARDAGAQVCVQDGCLPPVLSAYGGPFVHHFSFGGTTADFGELSLHSFSSCSSPPPSVPGSSVLIGFTATMDFKLSINGGPAVPGQANANVTMFARYDGQSGPVSFYTTELVQLDLAGGGLGSAMIRESPTLASTGPTTIEDLGGGNFRIDSFFDVFFEISFDGGVSWVPAYNDPGTMTLTGPGCPTPNRGSTWGRVKAMYR